MELTFFGDPLASLRRSSLFLGVLIIYQASIYSILAA